MSEAKRPQGMLTSGFLAEEEVMNSSTNRCAPWLALVIFFTVGCTEKNKMTPNTTERDPPMAAVVSCSLTARR